MERLDMLGFLIVTLSCNVTILGKIWLLVSVVLRLAAVVLAGSPVYQDEQERFVCNTLQPGCANVCYDAFAPLSPLRFWLLHSLLVLLPPAIFLLCVLHRAAAVCACAAGGGGAARGTRGGDWPPAVPDFSRGYAAQLCARSLAEAGLGAWQYARFGLLPPSHVSCGRAPCSGAVDCWVSRPTEKALLALGLWALGAVSLLLSLADLLCGLRWGCGSGAGRQARGSSGETHGGLRETEAPREDGSDGLSSAGHEEPGASPPRGHPSSQELQLAPRSPLPTPAPPSISWSAPHLRARKSEWV